MRVQVLLALPLDKLFDYEAESSVVCGQLVRAPFGTRHVVGCVWHVGGEGAYRGTLRSVLALEGDIILDKTLRDFIDWSAAWTCAPKGGFLKMTLGSMGGKGFIPSPRRDTRLVLSQAYQQAYASSLSVQQKKVVSHMRASAVAYGSQSSLAKACGVSASVVSGLCRQNIITSVSSQGTHASVSSLSRGWFMSSPPLLGRLNREQRAASASLRESLCGGFRVTLLQGVTGSGKTWVYLDLVREVLRTGKQGLILLPEILLTHHWLEHCRSILGVEPLVWHSGLSSSTRRALWHRVVRGEGDVVVGARSALFLPLKRLGLIVVDEEHEPSYKQEDGVVYHARDLAIVRAKGVPCGVILSSATPSIETYVNVRHKKYHRVLLQKRFREARLPRWRLIDMREETLHKGDFLSMPLLEGIQQRMEKKEQSLLFLNRRGYAPLTVCSHCGTWLTGPHCENRLVQHRHVPKMLCHYCGYDMAIPSHCPHCGESDTWRSCGPGVDRIEEELKRRLPHARVLVLASDRMKGKRAEMEDALGRIAGMDVDVVIGTQMAAKGHHFPAMTLVGVVDADMGACHGSYDLRVGERMFQTLHQVAGRAGRGEKEGEALVQTYDVDNDIFRALISHDTERFLRQESQGRARFSLPPYGSMAALILSSPNDTHVEQVARALAQEFPHQEGISLYGPTHAPIRMIAGRHRWRLLVKSDAKRSLAPLIRDWVGRLSLPSSVRCVIDIDPLSFF